MARQVDKLRSTSPGKRRCRQGPAAAAALLLALTLLLVAAGSAAAATVSGTLKNGTGYQVVVVQTNGTAGKATIVKTSGAFSIKGVKLNKATLHLVQADGSYLGPIVLKARGAKAYCTLKGSASLRIGTATLKAGYALVKVMPRTRIETRPQFTVTALRGKPLGAAKLGRVRTGKPLGLRGAGGDLDRDGVVGAFDIDDNGNLILDNVDRTGRGANRPLAQRLAVADADTSALGMVREDPPPGPEPAPEPTPEFRVFSNFKLGNDTRINVSIPGISDVDALIARELPTTLWLSIPIMAGPKATLDGLGNSYYQEHTVGDLVYPRIELAWPDMSPATHTGTLLDLVAGEGRGGGALIMPGALPAEISAGDSFVETTADGKIYPGTLNFVFNTAPAVKSYQFDTDATATEVAYSAAGVPANRLITVPSGATAVTVTWWRPQRKASPGEAGNAGGWVDIGGLDYSAGWFPARANSGPSALELPGTHDARGAYSNASANGVPIVTMAETEVVTDPTADAASSADNTMSFTLSLTKSFSGWSSFGPGTFIEFGLDGRTQFGDNADCRLSFVLQ